MALTALQKAVARDISFRDGSTTLVEIAKARGIDARTLRRWRTLPEFGAEVRRVQEGQTQLSLDEAWSRLSLKDRQRLLDRAQEEHGGTTIGLDVRDGLQRIEDSVRVFLRESSAAFLEREQIVEETSMKVLQLARRLWCLVSGEDPTHIPTPEELICQLQELRMIADDFGVVLDDDEDRSDAVTGRSSRNWRPDLDDDAEDEDDFVYMTDDT